MKLLKMIYKISRNVSYDELVYGMVCATSLEERSRDEYLAEVKEVWAKNEGRYNYDDGTYAKRRTLDLYWIKVQHRDPKTMAVHALLIVRMCRRSVRAS